MKHIYCRAYIGLYRYKVTRFDGKFIWFVYCEGGEEKKVSRTKLSTGAGYARINFMEETEELSNEFEQLIKRARLKKRITAILRALEINPDLERVYSIFTTNRKGYTEMNFNEIDISKPYIMAPTSVFKHITGRIVINVQAGTRVFHNYAGIPVFESKAQGLQKSSFYYLWKGHNLSDNESLTPWYKSTRERCRCKTCVDNELKALGYDQGLQ